MIIILFTQIYINQIFKIRLESSQHTQRPSTEEGRYREVERGRLHEGRDGYRDGAWVRGRVLRKMMMGEWWIDSYVAQALE